MNSPVLYRVTDRNMPPKMSTEEIFQSIEGGLAPVLAEYSLTGKKIGILVGSRGIRSLQEIVTCLIQVLQTNGAEVVLLPAMGSHGGATAEGQQTILEEYGLGQKITGVPILSCMDVTQVGDVDEHPVYVDFGLSHFIISSVKRDLIRSSFRATDDTVYLGVVQYIFGSCQDIFLSSCFLTYKNKESLCKYRDSISATRIKTISNKIARLMESYFDAQEIAVLSQILKLAVVDVTSDHIYYPTIPEEVVDIIERNGLHYE